MVSSLSEGELFEFVDSEVKKGDAKEVGEVILFYECRCSLEMISKMIQEMGEDDREEVWGDLVELQIECPRCGREYSLKRSERSEV